MGRPETVPQPAQQAIDHAGDHLPKPMDLAEFPGFPELTAPQFPALSLPDQAVADVGVPAVDLPDFIFDLG